VKREEALSRNVGQDHSTRRLAADGGRRSRGGSQRGAAQARPWPPARRLSSPLPAFIAV
jgi:hypothetical protein